MLEGCQGSNRGRIQFYFNNHESYGQCPYERAFPLSHPSVMDWSGIFHARDNSAGYQQYSRVTSGHEIEGFWISYLRFLLAGLNLVLDRLLGFSFSSRAETVDPVLRGDDLVACAIGSSGIGFGTMPAARNKVSISRSSSSSIWPRRKPLRNVIGP